MSKQGKPSGAGGPVDDGDDDDDDDDDGKPDSEADALDDEADTGGESGSGAGGSGAGHADHAGHVSDAGDDDDDDDLDDDEEDDLDDEDGAGNEVEPDGGDDLSHPVVVVQVERALSPYRRLLPAEVLTGFGKAVGIVLSSHPDVVPLVHHLHEVTVYEGGTPPAPRFIFEGDTLLWHHIQVALMERLRAYTRRKGRTPIVPPEASESALYVCTMSFENGLSRAAGKGAGASRGAGKGAGTGTGAGKGAGAGADASAGKGAGAGAGAGAGKGAGAGAGKGAEPADAVRMRVEALCDGMIGAMFFGLVCHVEWAPDALAEWGDTGRVLTVIQPESKAALRRAVASLPKPDAAALDLYERHLGDMEKVSRSMRVNDDDAVIYVARAFERLGAELRAAALASPRDRHGLH